MGKNNIKTNFKMVKYCETVAEFDEAVKGECLVVVDFTATWCPPCQRIGPKFEALDGKYEGVTLFKVDVDKNAEASEKAGIECMPTFKFYKGGVEVHQIQGADEAGIIAKMEELK